MNDIKTGDIINFGGYEWRVLDLQDGKALIIAEDIVEERYYHNEQKDITWDKCDLREYLNNEFYNSFNEDDKARIIPVENFTPDNKWFEKTGGFNTRDYIFLLSLNEVCKYFGDSTEDLKNKKSWKHEVIGYDEEGFPICGYVPEDIKYEYYYYATYSGERYGQYLSDHNNVNRIAKYDGENEAWWLRTPGRFPPYLIPLVVYVEADGAIDVMGEIIGGCLDDVCAYGVRPAIWIKIKQE